MFCIVPWVWRQADYSKLRALKVMDAQEDVLKKERELDEARVKLSAIRKAKYKDRPAGSHEASPDGGPYYSDF